MNCELVRNWLVQAESLQPKGWPVKLTDHLKGCAECRKFVNALLKLEKSWREQPLPASCATGKAAFLKQVARQRQAVPARRGAGSWRPMRWAAAAVVLIGVGLAGWFVLSPTESRASEVVDKLVDWNADLTRTEFAKRKQLLEAKEDSFRKKLQSARLSAEERASGEQLIEAARKLALLSDDFEEDEIIVTDVADKLFERAKNAQERGREDESDHCNRRYRTFMDKAVHPLYSRMRIIDRLIDLNMAMASADAKKRKQLFDENEESLRNDLKDANLPPEDQAMADKLFEVSRRLAANTDLGLQAQAVTEAAEKLRLRAEEAEKKGKTKASDRAAIGYSMFVSKALNPFFDKVKTMQPKGPPDAKKGGFDFTKFQKEFDFNRQRASQFNRPEMHNRFEAQTKKGFSWPFKGGRK